MSITKGARLLMRKLIVIFLTMTVGVFAQAIKPVAGLQVSFKSGESTDTVTTPDVALYVPAGESAPPFLPVGRFTAVWEGVINIDLRGDYSFQVIGRGSVKLVLNNEMLLDLPGISALAKPPTTKIVRLNKGANSIKVTYVSPNKGDAQLRLLWSELPDKPLPHDPIRRSQLTHNPNSTLLQSNLRRDGRGLFLEARCIRCHQSDN